MNRSRTQFCGDVASSISTEAFTDVLGEPHKYKGINVLYELEQSSPEIKIMECRNGVGDKEFCVDIEAGEEHHNTILKSLNNAVDNEGHKLTVEEEIDGNILRLIIGKVI